MGTTRVKVCGITSLVDALDAAACGVDAIGLVFYAPSPRHLADLELARDIALSVGPYVNVVGLFVDASEAYISSALQAVPIHTLQFHGSESAQFCESFGRPYYKALRMHAQVDIEQACKQFVSASGLLLDTYKKGQPGGTGESFDWHRVPRDIPNIVLAGGLTPDNVAQAIRTAQPYAVDVSGGVESMPGKKDSTKVKAFVDAVKSTESFP